MWQRSMCNFFQPFLYFFSLNLTLQRASSGLKDLYFALISLCVFTADSFFF